MFFKESLFPPCLTLNLVDLFSTKFTMSKAKKSIKKVRIFSDTFKRQKVEEISSGLLTVTQVSRLYKVSRSAVYKWLYRYSDYHKKGIVQVVQMKSEAKKTEELLSRVAELEAHLGRKQLEIDYLNKLLEISSAELKIDLKKSFDAKCSMPFTATSKQKDTL